MPLAFTARLVACLAATLVAAACAPHAPPPAATGSDLLPPAPAAIPEKGPGVQRLVFISDLNGSYGSTTYRPSVHALVRLAVDLRPDAVITAGDMVAGQFRALTDPRIYAMWDALARDVVAPLADAGIPFIPCPGNHDASGYPAFTRERDIYASRFAPDAPPPLAQPASRAATRPITRPADGILADSARRLRFVDRARYPLQYAVAVDKTLIVILDATTVQPVPDEAVQWLDAQLARPGYTARIVACHVPPVPYAVGRENETIPEPSASALLRVLRDRNATLWVTGHHHAYYKARHDGVNLLGLNAAGDGPRPYIGATRPATQSMAVVDLRDGRVVQCFAVQPDGTIVPDDTLPPEIRHNRITVRRFDAAR